jgi:hypothetical protein
MYSHLVDRRGERGIWNTDPDRREKHGRWNMDPTEQVRENKTDNRYLITDTKKGSEKNRPFTTRNSDTGKWR